MTVKVSTAIFYLEAIANAGIFSYIITSMYIITLDRFLIAHYNIRYVKFWTRQKASVVILLQLLSSFLYAVALMIWHDEDYNQLRVHLAHYWIISDYAYLIIAALTYLYIIKIYAHNRPRTTSIRPAMTTAADGSSLAAPVFKTADEDDLDEFQRRRFMYSVFMISFFICVVIPDQTYFITFIVHGGISFEGDVSLISLFCVGLIADAINYVWCLKKLRCIWISMLPRQLRCCKMVDSSEHNEDQGKSSA